MTHRCLALAAALLVTAAPRSQDDQHGPHVARALALAASGDDEAALAAVRHALEFDDHSLAALRLLADLALARGNVDEAVHALHRWLDIVNAADTSPVLPKEHDAVLEQLTSVDPEARSWERLRREFARDVIALAKEYKKRKDWLAALETFNQVLAIDPFDRAALDGVKAVRREGGSEVAIEDIYAGTDPLRGKTQEELRLGDLRHASWLDAWTKNTDSYRVRTNAGFVVLETAAIAMEQMNGFYRKFFRYKEDGGKTPKIEVRIFKSRTEYLELGSSPAEWSGGQFTGSAVETYVGGITGEDSIREMYRTLFHEAAHQFVGLSIPFVPGWLNEAYASFFEGCVILSNGTVKWNRAPTGRLMPLAARLENGWMADPNDGVRDNAGEWATPETAPTLQILVGGDYQWGPPWYAPTWGLVYFLYNYRTEDGQPIYRDALHAYAQSFRRGRPKDGVAHFEEIVLAASPLSPVQTIDPLNEIWRRWILALRDRYNGKTTGGDELRTWGLAALERGDQAAALEFFNEALEQEVDLEVLEQVFTLHEKLGNKARAAATCRQLVRELELRGQGDDDRHRRLQTRLLQLDPIARRREDLHGEIARRGLALARSYEVRELPTMALEIARRMSSRFSIGDAITFYEDVARRSHKTLARWRRAYDEISLNGWSGATDEYRSDGAEIEGAVVETSADAIATRELVCDVTFDADYSLEAEMRIEAQDDGWAGSWMGLCFGHKGSQNFHAVMLHPKGFMDIATSLGGTWEVRDHRTATIGSEWRKLRIDVTGKSLDVYLDGKYVRALDFPNPETLRGAFGLITGSGVARYRNIRVLGHDSHDPAARIERELAMERIADDAALRQVGSFAGRRPPEIAVATWVQGEPTTLAALRGRPVVLAFWTPAQDRVIPTAAYLAHLAARCGDRASVVIVTDASTEEPALRSYLSEHPIPGARIGIDDPNLTFDAYWVKVGYHGMPRILLLDSAGEVVFEGDPGLTAGEGWRPGMETYVDASFDRVIDKAQNEPGAHGDKDEEATGR